MKFCELIVLLLFPAFFYSQDTLTKADFNLEQSAIWKSTEQQWITNHFNPFCKTHKLQVSCAKCSAFLLEVVFTNKNQKTHAAILKHAYCGKPLSAKQLNNLQSLLEKMHLPKQFGNAPVKISFSRILKC